MNIIYTGPFRFPNGDAAATRVLHNGKLLQSIGHSVFFAGWESSEENKGSIGEEKCFQGFFYKSMSEFRQGKTSILKRLFGFIKQGMKTFSWIKNQKEIDAIILYNPPILFFHLVKRYAKKQGLILILDITEWYDGSHLPGGLFGPVSILNEIKMRYSFTGCKNIIAISSYLTLFYKNTKNNVITIPPLIDKNDFSINVNQEKNKTLNLVYAGNPGQKDTLPLIVSSIIALLHKGYAIKFTIVGITAKQFNNQSNLKINDRYLPYINFVGRIPKSEVSAYYLESDFSIFIRQIKRYSMAGFPTKLVESQIMGVPVITNTSSDISMYITDTVNGLLIEGNASEQNLIETLIKATCISGESLCSMKRQSRKSAIEHFHFSSKNAELNYFMEHVLL